MLTTSGSPRMSRLWPSSGRRPPCGALDKRSRSYRHIHAHDGAHSQNRPSERAITKQFGFAVTCAAATPQPRNIQPRLSMGKSALLGGCLRSDRGRVVTAECLARLVGGPVIHLWGFGLPTQPGGGRAITLRPLCCANILLCSPSSCHRKKWPAGGHCHPLKADLCESSLNYWSVK
jgi:hypothetical protein